MDQNVKINPLDVPYVCFWSTRFFQYKCVIIQVCNLLDIINDLENVLASVQVGCPSEYFTHTKNCILKSNCIIHNFVSHSN